MNKDIDIQDSDTEASKIVERSSLLEVSQKNTAQEELPLIASSLLKLLPKLRPRFPKRVAL